MKPVDEVKAVGREVDEIIFSAPLPRLREADGSEWVDRDALAAAVREHFKRRSTRMSGRTMPRIPPQAAGASSLKADGSR